MFRRTLLYAGLPNSSRWYEVAGAGERVGSRALIYLRKKDGVGSHRFSTFINKPLVSALAATGALKELRTQTFLPWSEKFWDTPNVAHDNPVDQQFCASLILGFADAGRANGILHGRRDRRPVRRAGSLRLRHSRLRRAAALTYVKDGTILPHYQQ